MIHQSPMDQTKETVLITGASSGIGLELARCFAADKSRLVLTARNHAALENLAAELRRNHGIQVEIVVADLADKSSPQRIHDELKGRGIAVDVLVNNAGFGAMGEFCALPLNRQLEMIQVNISALVELTGLFLPGMKMTGRGGILNVGSLAGFQPGPGMAVYFATKAFVLSFTEAIAEECRDSKVLISAFCPGSTETNFGQVARAGRERKHRISKMSAVEVARIGHEQFRRGRLIVLPGIRNAIVPQLLRILPRSVVRRIAREINQEK